MEPRVMRYLEAAQRLFGPLGKEDGIPASELAAAEARLRVGLPAALREVYQRSGRRTDMHASQDRLQLPDELALEGDVLVFYEQAERAQLWGMRVGDLSQADPPVWRGESTSPLAWDPEAERLTGFLEAMLLTQRMSRGPWVMKRKVGAALLERLQALYPPLRVESRLLASARWHGDTEGHLLRIQGEPPSAIVTVAAPTGDQLRSLGESLDLTWSDAEWAELTWR